VFERDFLCLWVGLVGDYLDGRLMLDYYNDFYSYLDDLGWREMEVVD
jgi:hypothetical protein